MEDTEMRGSPQPAPTPAQTVNEFHANPNETELARHLAYFTLPTDLPAAPQLQVRIRRLEASATYH